MSPLPPRSLPVVQPLPATGAAAPDAAGSSPGSAGEGVVVGMEPDPVRVEAGWTYRFTAAGARAEEMIRTYRDLGFEVVSDPVRTATDPAVCTVCYEDSSGPEKAIYTRPPSR